MKVFTVTLEVEADDCYSEEGVATDINKALTNLPTVPYLEYSNVQATLTEEIEEE